MVSDAIKYTHHPKMSLLHCAASTEGRGGDLVTVNSWCWVYLVKGRVDRPQLRQPTVRHMTDRICGREDCHSLDGTRHTVTGAHTAVGHLDRPQQHIQRTNRKKELAVLAHLLCVCFHVQSSVLRE